MNFAILTDSFVILTDFSVYKDLAYYKHTFLKKKGYDKF